MGPGEQDKQLPEIPYREREIEIGKIPVGRLAPVFQVNKRRDERKRDGRDQRPERAGLEELVNHSKFIRTRPRAPIPLCKRNPTATEERCHAFRGKF